MISETSSQASSALAQSQTTQTRSQSLTSDFDSFIKMLTAQAKYQDPLDPIDSTEFASQLAQFSMVEQQVYTNETLNALYGLMSTSNMASLAGWVGMDARSTSPMYFDGTPIEISPQPNKLADAAYLVVTDDSGKEIQRREIAVSDDLVTWQGLSDDGQIIEHGTYHFSVESFQNDALIQTEPAGVYGPIVEAQILNGEVVLILQGGQAVAASSVTALRSGS